ncbi:hypothetical protein TESG_05895 [Trichophyton tonsurans CBS 112818]|uniref:Uncharacterized protein n=2 Tax=Trichophyton TaxID=5550 RepID=F2PJR4_TRIEC|nr:hypothetical protein TESG_05895 [Trichophyton tonsurans CBS 112818]EGE02132.1 hypothetical protein TEQG_01171 [Trichophyton equinum CBS 127.97]
MRRALCGEVCYQNNGQLGGAEMKEAGIGYRPIIPQSLPIESAYVAGLLSALLLVGIRYPDAFARDNGGSSTPAAIQRHCSNGDSPPSHFDPSDGGNRLVLCHGSGAVRRMSFFGGTCIELLCLIVMGLYASYCDSSAVKLARIAIFEEIFWSQSIS